MVRRHRTAPRPHGRGPARPAGADRAGGRRRRGRSCRRHWPPSRATLKPARAWPASPRHRDPRPRPRPRASPGPRATTVSAGDYSDTSTVAEVQARPPVILPRYAASRKPRRGRAWRSGTAQPDAPRLGVTMVTGTHMERDMNKRGSTREAMLEEFRRKQLAPPDELELARRRAAGMMMDRLRVGVGEGFDVTSRLPTQ